MYCEVINSIDRYRSFIHGEIKKRKLLGNAEDCSACMPRLAFYCYKSLNNI